MPGNLSLDRYQELIKRLLEAKGSEVLADVSPELVPALVLENDRPEWLMLSGTRLWVAGFTVGASVGNFSSALIGAGSKYNQTVIAGFLAVTACNYGWSKAANSGFAATTGNVVLRDSRASGNPNTTVYTRQTTQFLAAAPVVIAAGAGATVSFDSKGMSIASSGDLTSNYLLYFETSAVNTALSIAAWGYERVTQLDEVDRTVL